MLSFGSDELFWLFLSVAVIASRKSAPARVLLWWDSKPSGSCDTEPLSFRWEGSSVCSEPRAEGRGSSESKPTWRPAPLFIIPCWKDDERWWGWAGFVLLISRQISMFCCCCWWCCSCYTAVVTAAVGRKKKLFV
jgi:hypothetical protein